MAWPIGKVVVLVALLGLTACLGEATERHVNQSEASSVTVLTLGTPLPPSATDIWVAERRFTDFDQHIRFDADLDEARSFVREVLGRDAVRGEDPHMGPISDYEWWLREFPVGAEGGRRDDVSRRFLLQAVILPMGRRARVWIGAGQG